jgi:hypothetical protein
MASSRALGAHGDDTRSVRRAPPAREEAAAQREAFGRNAVRAEAGALATPKDAGGTAAGASRTTGGGTGAFASPASPAATATASRTGAKRKR